MTAVNEDLDVQGNLFVMGAATFAGNLAVHGNTTIDGSLSVQGALDAVLGTNIVFKPFSGLSSGNVFQTWAEVMAAIATVDGAKTLQFDNTTSGVGQSIAVSAPGVGRLAIPSTSRYAFNVGMVGRELTLAGSIVDANNGNFTISAVIDAHTVDYVNAGVVADPVYAGAWIVTGGVGGTACVIPAGLWDMTMVHWYGEVRAFAVAGAGRVPVTISDGAQFENLYYIGGLVQLTNLSNTPSPPPNKISGPVIIKFGKDDSEGIPQVINSGTNPFWDISLVAAGQIVTFMTGGFVTGTTPSFGFGAGACELNPLVIKNGRFTTGWISGTNPAAILRIGNLSEGSQLNRIDNTASPYAGELRYGQQSDSQIIRQRVTMIPASIRQAPPVPSGVAITNTTGLGHNANLLFQSAGAVNQPLPIIRGAKNIANNLQSTQVGALNSTGISTTVKHTGGGGSVNVTGDRVANGVGDAFAVAAGVVTLTDAAGLFTAAMVGRAIAIAGSTTPANDGVYIVASFISPTQITYANAAGVTEAFPGTWIVGDTIDGATAAVVVPNGGSRTFRSDGVSNWQIVAGYL